MTLRRRNLREFQIQLNERINNAAVASKDSRLGVQIDDDKCLIDLEEISEIVPLPDGMTRVPGTQGWFRGLVSHRGVLIGVTDLGQFHRNRPAIVGKDAHLLVLNQKLGINAAILVSRLLGLHNLAQMEHLAPTGSETWQGGLWSDPGGESWRELRLSVLASDLRFMAVAA